MIVGMDFGTTNSGMAVYDGRSVRVLPLDPASENPRVLRTALYVRNNQDIVIGRGAINDYFDQNVGRSARLKRVWVGEIEVRADLVYYVTDVYVWVDVMSPGRLFLSFKTSLRDSEYSGTVVGQFFYPLEEIVALYLTTAKRRAEKLLGRELRQIVLGRPVRFATDPEKDRLAQERLLRAAFKAGYEKVYLQYEPIAAAYHYAASATSPQNILVFDFGGGTLDITVMRIDGAAREVLATGGIPIAGDVFDQKLVRAKLPPHFGEGSSYGIHGDKPVPRWIFDIFSDWQKILELQTPQNKRVLDEIAQTATRRREIEALISLVSGNYGLHMFDAAEAAKRELSDRLGAMIRLQGPGFKVMELVTRSEFETIIRPEYLTIEQRLQEVVAASGLEPAQIDAVIRTGGSSEIPLFRDLLAERFGREKLISIDTFSSVTAGLGLIAHGIEAGDLALPGYTPDDLPAPPEAETNVPIASLDLIQRRITLKESGADEDEAAAEVVLITLTEDKTVMAELLPARPFRKGETVPYGSGAAPSGLRNAIVATLDEPLVLLTSRYRFLMVSGRQLAELPALGLDLANLFHMGKGEEVCAIARWNPIKEHGKLVIATSRGFARCYETVMLGPQVEGPIAHMFERPLSGLPVALLGADGEEELVMMTGAGRANRTPLADVPLTGLDAMKPGVDDDWIVAAALGCPGDELLIATGEGYGRRLPLLTVEQAARPNQRGRVAVSRTPVAGLTRIQPNTPLWLITSSRLAPIEPGALPLDEDSIRTHRLLKLEQGEKLLAIASL